MGRFPSSSPSGARRTGQHPRPAKRSLGQNFLEDPNTARKIVAALELDAGDAVLEIGPGQGALTRWLVEAGQEGRVGPLVVLEKDRDLAPELKTRWPALNVAVADALEFAWEALDGRPWKLAGNLPYNVASPIMWECVRRVPRLALAVFMIQKEVAQRIGFPLVIRPSYTLGGTGGGFVRTKEAFDKALSTGLQGLDDVVLVPAGGEHDHGHGLPPGAQTPQDLHAAHLRHAHVQQYDVGSGLLYPLYALLAVAHRRDHVDAPSLEQLLQADAEQRMIIDEEDPHHRSRISGASASLSAGRKTSSTRVPSPGSLSMRRRPPNRRARSCMMDSPMCSPG